MNNACLKYIPSKKPEIKFEKRPWGNFQQFSENIPSTVKIITVNANEKISLQFHRERDEFWRILSGKCIVTIGDDTFQAKKNDKFFIPREASHRIEALSLPVEILEISFGKFYEDDIVRIEDAYERV